MTRLTANELEAPLNDLESNRAERSEAWTGDGTRGIRKFIKRGKPLAG